MNSKIRFVRHCGMKKKELEAFFYKLYTPPSPLKFILHHKLAKDFNVTSLKHSHWTDKYIFIIIMEGIIPPDVFQSELL